MSDSRALRRSRSSVGGRRFLAAGRLATAGRAVLRAAVFRDAVLRAAALRAAALRAALLATTFFAFFAFFAFRALPACRGFADAEREELRRAVFPALADERFFAAADRERGALTFRDLDLGAAFRAAFARAGFLLAMAILSGYLDNVKLSTVNSIGYASVSGPGGRTGSP